MRRTLAPGQILWRNAFIREDAPVTDDGDRVVEFIASDESVDRYGDVIMADGWELEHFRSNPIFLWSHDNRAPIGTVPTIGIVGKQLRATVRFAKGKQLAEELWSFVKDGILRAVSVGFSVNSEDDYEWIEDEDGNETGGIRFLRQELLELSLVAVPANRHALMRAKALNISESTIKRALPLDASVIEAHRANRSQILQLQIRGQRLSMPRQASRSLVRGTRP